MKKINLLILAAIFLMACSETTEPKKSEPKAKKENTKKQDSKKKSEEDPEVIPITNRKTGVRTEIKRKKGQKDGLSKQYYPSGKIWKESNYKDGYLDGLATIYHENGNLKRTVEYTKGKRNGTYTSYFKSGNVKASMEYEMDLPLPGLKEINYLKQEVKQPEIQVRHEDLLFKNAYNLYFSLKPKGKQVDFYVLEKKDDWNSEFNIIYYGLKKVGKDEYILDLNVPQGYYYINEFHVYATYTSKGGHEACVYKKVNLAVENE